MISSVFVPFASTKPTRFKVTSNKLSIAGLENTSSTAAVDAYFGKNFCLTNPLPGTLYFHGNSVIGPGIDEFDPLLKSGIRYDWICGAPPRKIELSDNYVEGFKFAGLEFAQCSDIQVSCNTIVNTFRAIELARNTEATGPAVRFKSNYLEVPLSTGLEVVRSDDAVKTKMGPSQSDRGDNALVANDQLVDWIRLNDADSSDVLNARQNYWYLIKPTGRQLITTIDIDGEPFASRLVSTGAIIDKSAFYTSDANSTFCHTPPPSVGMAHPILAELEGPDSPSLEGNSSGSVSSLGQFEDAAPEGSYLKGLLHARASIEVEFGIAVDDAGLYELSVFDVAGRRVQKLWNGRSEGGRYRITWDGRNDGGKRVGPGVYFMHLEGPRFTKTVKAVLVR